MRQAKAFDYNTSAEKLDEFLNDRNLVKSVYEIVVLGCMFIVYYEDGK